MFDNQLSTALTAFFFVEEKFKMCVLKSPKGPDIRTNLVLLSQVALLTCLVSPAVSRQQPPHSGHFNSGRSVGRWM